MELEDQRARPTPTSWPRIATSTAALPSTSAGYGVATGWTGNIAPLLAKGGKLGGAKDDGELVDRSRQCVGLSRPMFLPTSSFMTL